MLTEFKMVEYNMVEFKMASMSESRQLKLSWNLCDFSEVFSNSVVVNVAVIYSQNAIWLNQRW